MPKARRFGGVPGRCVEEKPDKLAVFFGVIKGRRKFFGGRGGHAVIRRFFCSMGVMLAKSGVVSAIRHFRCGV